MPIDFFPPPPPPRNGMPHRGGHEMREKKSFPKRIGLRIKGFLSRLFYIVSLVWETAPAVLILMALFCLLDGLLPVIGAYISKELLNGIADLIGESTTGSIKEDIFEVLKPVLFLLIMQFVYLFIKKVLERLNAGVTAIAGELVVNHIKLKIINKAKTVDMASFDNPEFYEKLENAYASLLERFESNYFEPEDVETLEAALNSMQRW